MIKSRDQLDQKHKLAVQKLEQAKAHGIKLFALDYDGNLAGSGVSHEQAADLIVAIAQADIFPVIISARGVTLLRTQLPLLKKPERMSALNQTPVLLSGGNGVAMWEFTQGRLSRVYSNTIDLEKCRQIAYVYQQVSKGFELKKKGIDTHQKFLDDWQWSGNWSIPNNYLQAAKNFNYICFFEPVKATMVLPADPKQAGRARVAMKELFGHELHIEGDAIFLHLSAKLSWEGQEIDNKIYAARKAMEILGVTEKMSVVAMGDQPARNDAALLKEFPFSFTNDQAFTPAQDNKPPYVLPLGRLDPVSAVHRAIRSIL